MVGKRHENTFIWITLLHSFQTEFYAEATVLQ